MSMVALEAEAAAMNILVVPVPDTAARLVARIMAALVLATAPRRVVTTRMARLAVMVALRA